MKFTYALHYSALISVMHSKPRKLNRCIDGEIGYNGSNNYIQRKNRLRETDILRTNKDTLVWKRAFEIFRSPTTF